MNELQDSIDHRIDGSAHVETDFTELAKRWGGYCLGAHKGKLLKLGLRIATALADYDEEFKKP